MRCSSSGNNAESEARCTVTMVNDEPANNGSSSGGCSVTPPAVQRREPMKRKQEESCASEKLLEAAVQVLNKSVNSSQQKDECEYFAATIANALRQLPGGDHIQMAYLGYGAMVKYSMTMYNMQVEVTQEADE